MNVHLGCYGVSEHTGIICPRCGQPTAVTVGFAVVATATLRTLHHVRRSGDTVISQQDIDRLSALTVWDRQSLLHVLKLDEERGLGVSYRVNADESDVTCYVDCSDLFFWACADAEEITPADFPDLERAVTDLEPLDAKYWAGELFCCRRRQMRPQGPWYGYCGKDGKVQRWFVPIAVEQIFDACGPERADSRKPPRPGDGRRWDYGGAEEPADFVAHFQPGGKFGP